MSEKKTPGQIEAEAKEHEKQYWNDRLNQERETGYDLALRQVVQDLASMLDENSIERLAALYERMERSDSPVMKDIKKRASVMPEYLRKQIWLRKTIGQYEEREQQ